MGFAASHARLASLIARKSDLELQSQFIDQHRMFLANRMNVLFSMNSNLDPESQAARVLEAKIRALQNADKKLEIHSNRLNHQREAIVPQIQSLRKVISENIQSSFGLMGRQR